MTDRDAVDELVNIFEINEDRHRDGDRRGWSQRVPRESDGCMRLQALKPKRNCPES